MKSSLLNGQAGMTKIVTHWDNNNPYTCRQTELRFHPNKLGQVMATEKLF